jgi:hypothetical protein
MILYPAIDIMYGQAVRLVEGKFEDSTTYHDDPLEAARSWVDAGARFLHVVDLDGARSGAPSRWSTCAGSSARPASRSSTAAGCEPSRTSATPCAPAPSEPSSAPPRSATSTSSTTSSASSAPASSSPSTSRTA